MIYTLLDSPIGDLMGVGDGTSINGLFTVGHHRRPDPAWTRDDRAFADLRGQLAEYFAGRRRAFDLVLASDGTAFQRSVWAALREVPYGQTASYAQIAARVGSPTAYRAVGSANGRNPLSIIVPCHRIVGADGKLIGYAGGIEAKRWLLAHERAQLGRS